MTPSGHWSLRVHTVCSTVAWCAALNAMWVAFTLLGGVVLGIGPATVTASILTRRRMRGESVRFRDFAMTWRREFARGSAIVLPLLAVVVALVGNYGFFAALGPRASVARLVTLGALVLAVAIGAYLAPMYAHYQLPLWAYVVKAARFCFARPSATILLLFVFTVLAFASAVMPALLATVSIGAWLHTSTWVCVRLFQENEDRLAAGPDHTEQVRALPTEPLRIH